MIQRAQSLFLLLAAVCAALTWLFAVESFHFSERRVEFRTNGILQGDGVEAVDAELPVPYHILHSVIALVLIAAIFLYRNRIRQARVVRGVWLMTLLVGVLQFISSNSLHAYLAKEGEFTSSYGVSFFLPLGVLVFAVLAERAIKKDEALVRSADRLR